MGVHASTQYFKYKWYAKGRHGTHSPFVYDFVEHVLQDKGPIRKEFTIVSPSLELKYENLLSRIAQRYNYTSVLNLPGDNKAVSVDMLIFNDAGPAQWLHQLDEYSALLDNESAVAVPGIYRTKEHAAAWKKLCTHHKVTMSLDMYGIGLLLFRLEFKEKQHFILKY